MSVVAEAVVGPVPRRKAAAPPGGGQSGQQTVRGAAPHRPARLLGGGSPCSPPVSPFSHTDGRAVSTPSTSTSSQYQISPGYLPLDPRRRVLDSPSLLVVPATGVGKRTRGFLHKRSQTQAAVGGVRPDDAGGAIIRRGIGKHLHMHPSAVLLDVGHVHVLLFILTCFSSICLTRIVGLQTSLTEMDVPQKIIIEMTRMKDESNRIKIVMRQYMGEELSSPTLQDVSNLEQQIESSLYKVRLRKEMHMSEDQSNYMFHMVTQERVIYPTISQTAIFFLPAHNLIFSFTLSGHVGVA